MRRKLLYVWTLCLLILVLGSMPVYAKKTVDTYQELTMYAGKTATFKIDGDRKKAKWTSSKKSVATVSKKGKVKAKKPGKCIIKAVLKNKTSIFRLTVKKKKKSDKSKPVAFDSNEISVKLQVQLWRNPKKSEVNVGALGDVGALGFLVSINKNGKVFRSFLVGSNGWRTDTEYDSKNNTYTIKVGFWMKKWGWAEVREPGSYYAPCFFSWECYNSSNQLVKSGVFSSGRIRVLGVFRGPIIIKGLKEDRYTVKISSYREK